MSAQNNEDMAKQNQGHLMNEFNSLANLIGSSGDTSLDFKLNLFSDNVAPDADGGGSFNNQQDNIINIDLGKQG